MATPARPASVPAAARAADLNRGRRSPRQATARIRTSKCAHGHSIGGRWHAGSRDHAPPPRLSAWPRIRRRPDLARRDRCELVPPPAVRRELDGRDAQAWVADGFLDAPREQPSPQRLSGPSRLSAILSRIARVAADPAGECCAAGGGDRGKGGVEDSVQGRVSRRSPVVLTTVASSKANRPRVVPARIAAVMNRAAGPDSADRERVEAAPAVMTARVRPRTLACATSGRQRSRPATWPAPPPPAVFLRRARRSGRPGCRRDPLAGVLAGGSCRESLLARRYRGR